MTAVAKAAHTSAGCGRLPTCSPRNKALFVGKLSPALSAMYKLGGSLQKNISRNGLDYLS